MGAEATRLFAVFKIRIGLAIALSALAGLAATPGNPVAGWKIAVLALAVLVSSAAAGAFNHYVERDLDARMERTRSRPFVTGVYRAGWPWLAAIGLMLAGSVAATAFAFNATAAAHVFLGAFVYGIVYTVWLKRRTAWNIVVGGLSGSFAVLAGAAAVDPMPGAVPLLLALVLFLWTPPHFWSLATALKNDYAAADVPMLPVVVGDKRAAQIILVHAALLSLLSLLPAALGLGPIYLACAATGGVWFVRASIGLVRNPGPEAAMRNFRASLVQLSLLLAGAIADPLVYG